MSCALIGCLAGSVISGWLSDRFGRKKLLILSAVLFVAASLGTGAAGSFVAFVLFRILGGIGIGLASNLSPMYIAEITPGNVRGRFVSLNQLTIVIGILAAQFINWRIAQTCTCRSNRQMIFLIPGTDRWAGDGCFMPVRSRQVCFLFLCGLCLKVRDGWQKILQTIKGSQYPY